MYDEACVYELLRVRDLRFRTLPRMPGPRLLAFAPRAPDTSQESLPRVGPSLLCLLGQDGDVSGRALRSWGVRLTQNVMELKRLSIAGEIYGETGEERGFQGQAALQQARPEKAAAIDAVLEALKFIKGRCMSWYRRCCRCRTPWCPREIAPGG